MNAHDIHKGLEVWTLQTLLNFSIAIGLFATGLALAQGYFRALERQLTLRVSVELWKTFQTLAVDLCLAVVVLVGFLVLNPDILADIKVAVPFQPVATLLFAAALVLRLCKGGHDSASPYALKALYLMLSGSVLNILGFTFIMEAASREYLELHPSAAWAFLKTHFRSNAAPYGLELAQLTFWICFPLLLLVFAWGMKAALAKFAPESGE